MFAGKKSAQIREILISESAWEEMTCLFAPSLAKEEKTGTSMAKPIITLNGLKIVIMLGMLVIILCGIRFAAEIIVPFILALFIAVIYNLFHITR